MLADLRFELMYELVTAKNRYKEKLMFKIAWMLPRWLVYFATIRLMVHATGGPYSNTVVGELTGMDALGRWEKQ